MSPWGCWAQGEPPGSWMLKELESEAVPPGYPPSVLTALSALVREGQEMGRFWPEKGLHLILCGQTLGLAAG